eukprot:5667488-Alexandrium_andersonii.AAC.1
MRGPPGDVTSRFGLLGSSDCSEQCSECPKMHSSYRTVLLQALSILLLETAWSCVGRSQALPGPFPGPFGQ